MTMALFERILFILQILVAIALCGLILLQHGKGADMGAAFGSGSSGSLFGAAGSANFLSRTTAVLATIFFLTSIGLTVFGTLHGKPQGLMEQGVMEKTVPAPKASDVPGQPATTTPGEVPVAPATGAVPAPGGTSKPGEVPK